MTNQERWACNDIVKIFFIEEIRKNEPREKIRIVNIDTLNSEEMKVIDFLESGEYIEKIEGDDSKRVITKAYYDYLKSAL